MATAEAVFFVAALATGFADFTAFLGAALTVFLAGAAFFETTQSHKPF